MHFFDTYALVEMAKGNPNYQKFSGCPIHASLFNKMEFFYSCLLEKTEKGAIGKMKEAKINVLEIGDSDIINACNFRLKHRAKKLSYADCIGYTLAKREGLGFLTGDRQFEGLENVEFVK